MGESRWDISALRLADCDELGRVHVAVWREAYAGTMSPEYLAGLSTERSAARWRRRCGDGSATDPAAGGTLVARDGGGSLVGFVSAGPTRDPDAPTQWELYAINLLARAHGTGLADELLQRGVGDRAATLWVVESNLRARRFYERHGFLDEGGRTEHDGTGTPEMRMIRLV